MKSKILSCSAVAIGVVLGANSANASFVGFNIGDVSVGYSDGYWDNHHHWHHWTHREDAARFRAAHAREYHSWRHDDRHHHD